MGTTATTVRRAGKLQRRRIIERPRLIALLDESTARVRMLVAAAGYGKTTLAEQWVVKDGRTIIVLNTARLLNSKEKLALETAVQEKAKA